MESCRSSASFWTFFSSARSWRKQANCKQKKHTITNANSKILDLILLAKAKLNWFCARYQVSCKLSILDKLPLDTGLAYVGFLKNALYVETRVFTRVKLLSRISLNSWIDYISCFTIYFQVRKDMSIPWTFISRDWINIFLFKKYFFKYFATFWGNLNILVILNIS